MEKHKKHQRNAGLRFYDLPQKHQIERPFLQSETLLAFAIALKNRNRRDCKPHSRID